VSDSNRGPLPLLFFRDGEWKYVSQQLIALADAALAVRSPSEVYTHLAIANFYLPSVTGPKMPADLSENTANA
jgi:hypothetical protein